MNAPVKPEVTLKSKPIVGEIPKGDPKTPADFNAQMERLLRQDGGQTIIDKIASAKPEITRRGPVTVSTYQIDGHTVELQQRHQFLYRRDSLVVDGVKVGNEARVGLFGLISVEKVGGPATEVVTKALAGVTAQHMAANPQQYGHTNSRDDGFLLAQNYPPNAPHGRPPGSPTGRFPAYGSADAERARDAEAMARSKATGYLDTGYDPGGSVEDRIRKNTRVYRIGDPKEAQRETGVVDDAKWLGGKAMGLARGVEGAVGNKSKEDLRAIPGKVANAVDAGYKTPIGTTLWNAGEITGEALYDAASSPTVINALRALWGMPPKEEVAGELPAAPTTLTDTGSTPGVIPATGTGASAPIPGLPDLPLTPPKALGGGSQPTTSTPAKPVVTPRPAATPKKKDPNERGDGY